MHHIKNEVEINNNNTIQYYHIMKLSITFNVTTIDHDGDYCSGNELEAEYDIETHEYTIPTQLKELLLVS